MTPDVYVDCYVANYANDPEVFTLYYYSGKTPVSPPECPCENAGYDCCCSSDRAL
jgi:hypothetical protein